MSSESDTDIEQDLENVDAAGGFSESDSSSDEDCEFVEPFADTTKFAKHADIIECTDGDVLPEPKLARLLGPYSLFKRLLTQSIMLLFVENSPIINTTVGELTVHFALLMLMGLQPRHRLKEHWDMKLGNSDFRDAMPRDRWLEIWNNLRTYDGVSHPNDPRRLVLDLVTQISDSFQEQLIPGSNKCVDECIGAFFGKRSPQSFFLPRKPSRQKNGLKFQALNDSVSAYMWCVFMQPRLCVLYRKATREAYSNVLKDKHARNPAFTLHQTTVQAVMEVQTEQKSGRRKGQTPPLLASIDKQSHKWGCLL